MSVTRTTQNGITSCTLTNKNGVKLTLITLGASVSKLILPDGTDIVLGYQMLDEYRENKFYLGCIVGRVANRLRDARFCLEGKTYQVSANIPPHSLHGGDIGFNKANWRVADVTDSSVSMFLVSSCGDQGFPGTLKTTVKYTLSDANEITIEYNAHTTVHGAWETEDEATIVNLTNHTYFNLAGKETYEIYGNMGGDSTQKDTILDHVMTITGDTYHPLDKDLVPLGNLKSVKNTPLDFTVPTRIGDRIKEAGGYDINYNMLDITENHPTDPSVKLFATLLEPVSQHVLKVYSDQPGVQLYSGNFLDGSQSGPGKDGQPLIKHGGVCLETQAWPNAINMPGAEKQVVVKPGETYTHKTVWALSRKTKTI